MSYQLTIDVKHCVDSSSDLSDDISCHVAIDLQSDLLGKDSRELQRLLSVAFNACTVTLKDAIRLCQKHKGDAPSEAASDRAIFKDHSAGNSPPSLRNGNRPTNTTGHPNAGGGQKPVSKSSTTSSLSQPASRGQRRVIKSICKRLNIMPEVAADNHHFILATITRRQASLLLDQLRRLENNPMVAQQHLALYSNRSEDGHVKWTPANRPLRSCQVCCA